MGKRVANFFKSEIISSIFYLAFGLCLVLIPDQTVNIICKIIFGLVMIAAGIYHIVIYAAEKKKATILDLFTGVIVMVLGIFLFFTPQIVIKILPYLLGAFVLVDSIWKIKGSYRLKKAERGRWKVLLIGCLIFIALGVSMLFYSFLDVSRMILFSGIILAADGVVDIVFLIMLRTGMRKAEKLCTAKEKEGLEQDKLQQTAVSDTAGNAGMADTEDYDYAEAARVNKSENTSCSMNSEAGSEYEENTAEYEKVSTESEAEKQIDTSDEDSYQISEPDIEAETAETADVADTAAVLEGKPEKPEKDVESPGREIREMLKNHDEPLEEWKD